MVILLGCDSRWRREWYPIRTLAIAACTNHADPARHGSAERDTAWHSREFVVKDCDGRLLAFGADQD